jgi:hypothetical protein
MERLVPKSKNNVVILTPRHRIEGFFYTYLNNRLLDELREERDFFAMTECKIHDLVTGRLVQEQPFLTIRDNEIEIIYLKEMPKKSKKLIVPEEALYVLPKERTWVEIFTHRYRIRGEIHVLLKERLSSEVNLLKRFVPVTKAQVYRPKDLKGPFLELDFLALNKNSISYICENRENADLEPVEEMEEARA